MSLDETVFAIQRPRYLVEEYVRLIQEFGLDQVQVFERAGVQIELNQDPPEPSPILKDEN